MGFLVDTLHWAPTQIDGSPRSLLAMFLDPVGACIQPAALEPFPEDPAAATEVEKGSADPHTDELKEDSEDAAEAVAKALETKLAKDADVPAPVPDAVPTPAPATEQVTAPVAAPIAV